MGSMILVLVLVVGLISILILGAFRPARVTSRREIMGRPRRRLGAVLAIVGVLGLLGGQWCAMAGVPDAIVAASEADTLVLHPKPGSGDSHRYLVRLLTFSDLVPDRPRLLEQLTGLVTLREEVELSPYGPSEVTPGEFAVHLAPAESGRLSCTFQATITQGSSHMSMQSSHWVDPDGTMVERLSFGTRRAAGRMTAVFPATVLPVALRANMILLVTPAPAGVEEVPLATLLDTPVGERILKATQTAPEAGPVGGGGSRGISRIFGALGIFAWIMLALAATGSAFFTARPGLGLGLFLLLAPFLIAGADGLSFARQRALLDHEDVRVRASAMAGLRLSTLQGWSGEKAVREAGESRGGVDQEIAERIERLVPVRNFRHVRKYIGSAGRSAPVESSGG